MTSLSKNARVAGLLYISSSLFGIVRLIYIPSALLVRGNAEVTSHNIAKHPLLFRCYSASVLLATCSAALYGYLSPWLSIGCSKEWTGRSLC